MDLDVRSLSSCGIHSAPAKRVIISRQSYWREKLCCQGKQGA